MIPKFENLTNLLDPIKYISPTGANVPELKPQIHGRYAAGDRGDNSGIWKVYDLATSSFLTTTDENIFGETNKGYLRFGWDAANNTWHTRDSSYDNHILHLEDSNDYWWPFAHTGLNRQADFDSTLIAWVWISDQDTFSDAIGGQLAGNSYYAGSVIGVRANSNTNDIDYIINKWTWRYTQGSFYWGDEFSDNVPKMDTGKWYCIAMVVEVSHAQGNHPHAASESDYATSKVVYINGERVVNSADKFYGYYIYDDSHQNSTRFQYQRHENHHKPRILTMGHRSFKGRVGVMGSWNIALTEQEIRQFYNFYKPRYTD